MALKVQIPEAVPQQAWGLSTELECFAFFNSASMNTDENCPSTPRRRILLIDDRRDAIFPVQRMLEMAGHEVYAAHDGSMGLQMATRLTPDVILCDIGLPGELNGYDVAAAIRAVPALKGAYMVAVSGHGEEDDRRLARESGFDFHITKPMSKEQLDKLMTTFPRFSAGATS